MVSINHHLNRISTRSKVTPATRMQARNYLLVMYGTCIYKGRFYVSSKVVLLTALNATGDGNYDYIYNYGGILREFKGHSYLRKTMPEMATTTSFIWGHFT